MTAPDVLDIAREALLVTLKIGAPMLLVALAIGLVISLIQALTQIQEATLAFVPKFIGIGVVFLLSVPFMLGTLTAFTHELAARIVQSGG